VKPGETADIYFIADKTGLFAPRCADHDWAGMKATIIVD
jgi:plastocyanin